MRLVNCIVCGVMFQKINKNDRLCSQPCREERHKQSAQNYRANHPDRIREQDRHYRQANRDRRQEQKRSYREAHSEKLREYQHHYYAEHPEKYREYHQRYRVKVAAALQVFKAVIGQCRFDDRFAARRILQQLTGEQSHDNATS